MASSLTVQVTILCSIFSFPYTTTAANGEGASNIGLDHIPGLTVLKDVDIWRNGEITSLSKTFGPDPEEWSGNSDLVADMSSTAMGCMYSSAIVGYIRKIDNYIANTRESINHSYARYEECITDLKGLVKSLQPIAEMVTTALSFTKMSSIRVDKNVLNALMSFYMHFYHTQDGELLFNINFTNDIKSLKLYTRRLIDAFAVLNCPWSSFDSDQFNDQIDCFTMVSQLNLPETHFKPEDLDPDKLVLRDVWSIKIDPDYNSSVGTMAVETDHYQMDLGHMVKRYMNNFSRSEIITQTQTRVFQCIASTFFYLISKIMELSPKDRRTLNRLNESLVMTAMNILKDLNFPGSLHVKFRKLLYQKSIYSQTPFDYLFEDSQCHIGTIENIIDDRKLISIEAMTDMLTRFSNAIEARKADIKKSVEINQTLCDYEYEEVGFFQYDTTLSKLTNTFIEKLLRAGRAAQILQPLKIKNLQFSLFTVFHLKFIDYLVSQCEAILSGSNDSDTATLLESCFYMTVISLVSVADMVDNQLGATLSVLKLTRPYNNGNRKLIDSMLSMKLYLNSDTVLNSRAPETAEQRPVDQVIGKLDVLKRYNRFVINLIEQYAKDKLPTTPSEMFTKEVSPQINQECGRFYSQTDKGLLIICVDGLIRKFLNRYEQQILQDINISDYTIEKLLLNDVLEMAASDGSNNLSMLHEVRISWEGRRKTFTEIVNIVKHTINPKYLYKYQSFVMKAIVFTMYEKMKTIVQSSTSDNNFQLYRSNLVTILNALNVVNSDFFPLGSFRVYQMIVDHFRIYFERYPGIDKNALIRIIEAEQHFLGIQKDSFGTVVNEIVHSIPDHTLGTSSRSDDVETAVEESPGVEMDGLSNIEQLQSYMAVVENIRTSLTNVALVLDLRQVSNLQI